MDYNKVIIGGTLVRDPELRYTPGGTAVCEFGIAINERWTDRDGGKQERTTFADVTAFGRTAEVIAEYFRKGGQIMIEGKLQTDEWQDKNSGQKRSKLKVVANGFQFVNKNEGGGSAPRGDRPRDVKEEEKVPEDRGAFEDDDIPF